MSKPSDNEHLSPQLYIEECIKLLKPLSPEDIYKSKAERRSVTILDAERFQEAIWRLNDLIMQWDEDTVEELERLHGDENQNENT